MLHLAVLRTRVWHHEAPPTDRFRPGTPIRQQRLPVPVFGHDRGRVLAHEAPERRVCKCKAEGDVAAEPLAVDADRVVERRRDEAQCILMSSEELLHGPPSMLWHDEHVVAGSVKLIAELREDVRGPPEPWDKDVRHRPAVYETDELVGVGPSAEASRANGVLDLRGIRLDDVMALPEVGRPHELSRLDEAQRDETFTN